MLWIFGDSFSVLRQDINKGDGIDYTLWHEFVAVSLGNSIENNFSQWGVSNEYIADMFANKYPEIADDDIVIVQLTSSYRQWFFEDRPDLANYHINNIKNYVSPEEADAMTSYIKYLKNNKVDSIRYKLLEYGLKHIAERSKFKMLILPGFDPIEGVSGTLLDICDNEFVDTKSRDTWYVTNGSDPRSNHLSPDNHKILADKIIDFFKTGKQIDLFSGFQSKFL